MSGIAVLSVRSHRGAPHAASVGDRCRNRGAREDEARSPGLHKAVHGDRVPREAWPCAEEFIAAADQTREVTRLGRSSVVPADARVPVSALSGMPVTPRS